MISAATGIRTSAEADDASLWDRFVEGPPRTPAPATPKPEKEAPVVPPVTQEERRAEWRLASQAFEADYASLATSLGAAHKSPQWEAIAAKLKHVWNSNRPGALDLVYDVCREGITESFQSVPRREAALTSLLAWRDGFHKLEDAHFTFQHALPDYRDTYARSFVGFQTELTAHFANVRLHEQDLSVHADGAFTDTYDVSLAAMSVGAVLDAVDQGKLQSSDETIAASVLVARRVHDLSHPLGVLNGLLLPYGLRASDLNATERKYVHADFVACGAVRTALNGLQTLSTQATHAWGWTPTRPRRRRRKRRIPARGGVGSGNKQRKKEEEEGDNDDTFFDVEEGDDDAFFFDAETLEEELDNEDDRTLRFLRDLDRLKRERPDTTPLPTDVFSAFMMRPNTDLVHILDVDLESADFEANMREREDIVRNHLRISHRLEANFVRYRAGREQRSRIEGELDLIADMLTNTHDQRSASGVAPEDAPKVRNAISEYLTLNNAARTELIKKQLAQILIVHERTEAQGDRGGGGAVRSQQVRKRTKSISQPPPPVVPEEEEEEDVNTGGATSKLGRFLTYAAVIVAAGAFVAVQEYYLKAPLSWITWGAGTLFSGVMRYNNSVKHITKLAETQVNVLHAHATLEHATHAFEARVEDTLGAEILKEKDFARTINQNMAVLKTSGIVFDRVQEALNGMRAAVVPQVIEYNILTENYDELLGVLGGDQGDASTPQNDIRAIGQQVGAETACQPMTSKTLEVIRQLRARVDAGTIEELADHDKFTTWLDGVVGGTEGGLERIGSWACNPKDVTSIVQQHLRDRYDGISVSADVLRKLSVDLAKDVDVPALDAEAPEIEDLKALAGGGGGPSPETVSVDDLNASIARISDATQNAALQTRESGEVLRGIIAATDKLVDAFTDNAKVSSKAIEGMRASAAHLHQKVAEMRAANTHVLSHLHLAGLQFNRRFIGELTAAYTRSASAEEGRDAVGDVYEAIQSQSNVNAILLDGRSPLAAADRDADLHAFCASVDLGQNGVPTDTLSAAAPTNAGAFFMAAGEGTVMADAMLGALGVLATDPSPDELKAGLDRVFSASALLTYDNQGDLRQMADDISGIYRVTASGTDGTRDDPTFMFAFKPIARKDLNEAFLARAARAHNAFEKLTLRNFSETDTLTHYDLVPLEPAIGVQATLRTINSVSYYTLLFSGATRVIEGLALLGSVGSHLFYGMLHQVASGTGVADATDAPMSDRDVQTERNTLADSVKRMQRQVTAYMSGEVLQNPVGVSESVQEAAGRLRGLDALSLRDLFGATGDFLRRGGRDTDPAPSRTESAQRMLRQLLLPIAAVTMAGAFTLGASGENVVNVMQSLGIGAINMQVGAGALALVLAPVMLPLIRQYAPVAVRDLVTEGLAMLPDLSVLTSAWPVIVATRSISGDVLWGVMRAPSKIISLLGALMGTVGGAVTVGNAFFLSTFALRYFNGAADLHLIGLEMFFTLGFRLLVPRVVRLLGGTLFTALDGGRTGALKQAIWGPDGLNMGSKIGTLADREHQYAALIDLPLQDIVEHVIGLMKELETGASTLPEKTRRGEFIHDAIDTYRHHQTMTVVGVAILEAVATPVVTVLGAAYATDAFHLWVREPFLESTPADIGSIPTLRGLSAGLASEGHDRAANEAGTSIATTFADTQRALSSEGALEGGLAAADRTLSDAMGTLVRAGDGWVAAFNIERPKEAF